MKLRLLEKSLDNTEITAPDFSEWFDIGGLGADSLAATLVVSNGSTPTDAEVQWQGAIRSDKADAILVGTAVDISSDQVYVAAIDRPPLRYYRLAYAIASGSFEVQASVLAKGDLD